MSQPVKPLNSASLSDVPAIKALLDASPAELLGVTKAEIVKAVAGGSCLWDEGVALIYRRTKERSYYGVPTELGAYQIMYLATTVKGDGSAQRFLTAFFAQVKHQVFLLVKSDNPRAIRFYEKNGFVSRKTVQFLKFSSILMVRDGNH